MSALERCFGGMGTVSHYDDDATISQNNENCNRLQASSSLKRYRKKSPVSGTQKETRQQGGGKESESSLFPLPLCSFTARSHVRLPLELERLLYGTRPPHSESPEAKKVKT